MGISQERATTSNRYTILGRLAGGGMAEIFLARVVNEAGIERHVVLKRVLPAHTRDPVFAQMFFDEASLAAQLQHPNIAQVHDIGKLAGSYFFTMEYVHGEDVRAILKKLHSVRRYLPENLALFVAAGALAALHHAHEGTASDGTRLNIVHRDVSPSNVMVSYEGIVKLLDFGVAKAAHRAVETRVGTIKGKIEYLSPEQCHGKPIDCRSDIFSLGIVLHEMLVGKRLYKRESDFETMTAIVNEPVVPPSHLRPELSASVDQIVLTALAKDPRQRYATAADMLEAIETVAAAEKRVLSGTAMGRFMREVFGERPRPWLDLRLRDDIAAQEVTITTHTGELTGAPPEEEIVVEAQLERAPALWLADQSSPSGSVTPLPGTVQPLPAPISSAFPVQPPPSAPTTLDDPQPVPSVRRRTTVILVAASITLALGIAILVVTRGSSAPAQEDAAQLASVPGSPADAESVPLVDASVAVTIRDAVSVDSRVDPVPRPHAAIDAATSTEALRACAAKTKTLSADDRTRCGIAACNARQRSAALDYHGGASRAAQAAIERACRAHDISLAQPPSTPQKPTPKDPCDVNPLKCRE